ncbi:CCR4-NOT transcription complex subunit 6 [Eumeta japonica]|uniref:poly(A)-specific ribonuclease n=1 Tax=Eumeta variegata TaxID=151549 RepID=A0A4C1TJC3_EUMVA|nr:CCR4-NOT transcription complex subunit 6 [Eumeta japonica]
MPEWKGRVPLTRSHCERITTRQQTLTAPRPAMGVLGGPQAFQLEKIFSAPYVYFKKKQNLDWDQNSNQKRSQGSIESRDHGYRRGQNKGYQFGRPMSLPSAGIFTVMCYNVLCDKYATRQMYGYCPSWALEWDYRKKGILDEIRHYAADIISLQEVETDQFYNFFLPELKQEGYDGIFSPKSRAKTMSESERKYVDGCAIFFRSAKFSLVKEHLIEFNQLAMANSEGSDNMLNRVMPKDNIGLAALLKTKEAAWENGLPTDASQMGQPILVCTAHIHWDPEYCDVKLIQTMMLSNELRSILDDSARTLRLAGQRDNVQLLLCGDFNSLPDSGVVEFLSSGRVSADHRDFKELGYAASLRRMPGSEHEFTHNFKLASAYSEDIMPYTNYTLWLPYSTKVLVKTNQTCPNSMGLRRLITEFLRPPSSSIIRLWLPHSTKVLSKTNQTSPNSMGLRRLITEFLWPPSSSIIRLWLPYSTKVLGKTNQTSPNSMGLRCSITEFLWPPSNSIIKPWFDFKGIIDYIFYSKQSMTPLGLLGPLSQDWFRENKIVGCPHPHIPSDVVHNTRYSTDKKNNSYFKSLSVVGGTRNVSEHKQQLERSHRAKVAGRAATPTLPRALRAPLPASRPLLLVILD